VTNTPVIGRVYHVVDKTTGETVKVGSTIRALKKRWSLYDKKRFSNHYLRLEKEIKSSEDDWYSSDISDCPFLWHLMASEHLEIVRKNTFNNGLLSNKLSPLVQKYIGFDANESAKLGGILGGAKALEEKLGIHSPDFDRRPNGIKSGRRHVESGHLKSISSKGGLACGALMEKEKKGIFSPDYDRVAAGRIYGKISGKIGGPKGMHKRWHTRRGLVSPNCKYCTGQQDVIESSEHAQLRSTLHTI
jgi:hypothetical protein